MDIRSDIASKEFKLSIKRSTNECYLSVVAYGEWWEEHFENTDVLEKNLIDVWGFDEEQLKELYGNARVY